MNVYPVINHLLCVEYVDHVAKCVIYLVYYVSTKISFKDTVTVAFKRTCGWCSDILNHTFNVGNWKADGLIPLYK